MYEFDCPMLQERLSLQHVAVFFCLQVLCWFKLLLQAVELELLFKCQVHCCLRLFLGATIARVGKEPWKL